MEIHVLSSFLQRNFKPQSKSPMELMPSCTYLDGICVYAISLNNGTTSRTKPISPRSHMEWNKETVETAHQLYLQFERDMKVIMRLNPKGTKDIDPDFAFHLYMAGFLDRETPFQVVFEDTPGQYFWCSRDYERLSWATITGSTNKV